MQVGYPAAAGCPGSQGIACERRRAIEVAIETIVPLACCPSCGHAGIVPKCDRRTRGRAQHHRRERR